MPPGPKPYLCRGSALILHNITMNSSMINRCSPQLHHHIYIYTHIYTYINNHLTWPVTSPLYHHISVISPYLAITYSMIPAFYTIISPWHPPWHPHHITMTVYNTIVQHHCTWYHHCTIVQHHDIFYDSMTHPILPRDIPHIQHVSTTSPWFPLLYHHCIAH